MCCIIIFLFTVKKKEISQKETNTTKELVTLLWRLLGTCCFFSPPTWRLLAVYPPSCLPRVEVLPSQGYYRHSVQPDIIFKEAGTLLHIFLFSFVLVCFLIYPSLQIFFFLAFKFVCSNDFSLVSLQILGCEVENVFWCL